MSCHACMEPAVPWRACFPAWGWMGVCRDFASCQAFPIQLMCEHMPEGRSASGCGRGFMHSLAGRFVRKGVAVSFLSMSVHCNTRTLRLNWLYPGEFQTLPSSFHRKAFIMTGYFQSTTDTLPHRKESRVPCPEDIQTEFSLAESFRWAESLWHQKYFDRGEESSPCSNLEDSDIKVFTSHEFYLSSMNLESFV